MFNPDERGVIRTYIAVTGEPPTQEQLEAAFDFTNLQALTTELVSARPAQGDAAFVTSLYEHLLDRTPGAEALGYWVGLLSGDGIGKARLAVEFQNSAAVDASGTGGLLDDSLALTPVNGQFSTSVPDNGDDVFSGDEWQVIQAYVALTGEPPSQAELEAVFEGYSNFDDLCKDLAAEHSGLSNSEFVTMLYQNLLSREPDSEGLAYWTSLLEGGALNPVSRGLLAADFQYVAWLNADSEAGLVDGSGGLTPTGERFHSCNGIERPDPLWEVDYVYLMSDHVGEELTLDVGTGETSALVFDGYSGDPVSVRNFTQDQDGEAGNLIAGVDALDFNDFLQTEVEFDTVCRPIRRAPIEFEDSGSGLNGNTVSIITFQGSGERPDQSWENLVAEDLIALLNGTEAYGDDANTSAFGDYDAANGKVAMDDNLGGIEGNINSHIFMVEDGDNAGAYKIFHVTSTRVDDSEAGAFDAGARLVGALDLGTSLSTNELDMEASLVGSTEWLAEASAGLG